jgi:tetratricopeptide (TPR) repeat protein
VNNNELYLQYRQAIQLIRVGRYEESLHILQEIDAERPETKNVLYAMAVCSEMLGRTDEALDLCEHLIARYDHPKARVIKARIEKAASEPELPTVDLLSDLGLSAPPASASPTPPPATAGEEEIPLALPASDSDPKEKPAKKGWLLRFSKKA